MMLSRNDQQKSASQARMDIKQVTPVIDRSLLFHDSRTMYDYNSSKGTMFTQVNDWFLKLSNAIPMNKDY